jgi:hypothetical protein
MGALSVEPLIWRLACYNGLIMAATMRRYHLGRSTMKDLNEATEFFTDETRALDDKAFWHKVNDVVAGMLRMEGFETLVEKFAATKGVRLERGAVDTVELVSERLNFNETEKKGILDHLTEGGDLSLYGLVNAVTRTAEDSESYDRAVELEKLGSDIIELPATMWKKIS